MQANESQRLEHIPTIGSTQWSICAVGNLTAGLNVLAALTATAHPAQLQDRS